MTAEQILALVEEYGQACVDLIATGDDRSAEVKAQIDAAVTRLANERDELAERLDSAAVFSTLYRSVTPDGKTWCETSQADEVVERSEGKVVRYEKLTKLLVPGRWEPWNPEETP